MKNAVLILSALLVACAYPELSKEDIDLINKCNEIGAQVKITIMGPGSFSNVAGINCRGDKP